MRFSDMMLKKLKPTDKKFYLREGGGFAIRVMPSGSITWLYIFTIDGKRKEMNLGEYPAVSLEVARQKYNDAYKVFKKDGMDPAAVTEKAKEERRKAPTIDDLCKEYIERHAKRFKKSWKEDERVLNKDVVPAWGNRKAADIVKRDVLRLLESVLDRGSPGQANNSFQIIRKMFNFAVERDVIPFSPCNGLKLPAPKNSRDRVLSESEIKSFWDNLPACSISNELRFALKLILVTAQRPGEVVGMHTDEIDGNWWTIPADRAKNGKTHRVPLSPMALEIIDQAIAHVRRIREIPSETEYGGFVFPSPHLSKNESMKRHALSIAVARNLEWPMTDEKGKPLFDEDGNQTTENRFGIDHFTPHDLRRTAATFMAERGEMDEVIDAVLNHAKQGVIKVYNQYRYDKEKQIALDSWARKLSSIVTGAASNVIPMNRKAA
jgi:integrase